MPRARVYAVLLCLLIAAIAIHAWWVYSVPPSTLRAQLIEVCPRMAFATTLVLLVALVAAIPDLIALAKECSSQPPCRPFEPGMPTAGTEGGSDETARTRPLAGGLKDRLSQLPLRTLISLLAIMLLAYMLATFVAPKTDRIQWDEDIYQNIGQNIALAGKAGISDDGRFLHGQYRPVRLSHNKEPSGYPVLLAFVYMLFDVTPDVAHTVNTVVFALAVLVAFLIALLLFNSTSIALLAALILALTPQAILWSHTSAAEPSAMLASALAVLAVLAYRRRPTWPLAAVAATLLVIAIQFRPESLLILLPCLVLLLTLPADPLPGGRASCPSSEPTVETPDPEPPLPPAGGPKMDWLHLLLALVILAELGGHHPAHLLAVRDEGWGSDGARFAWRHVLPNLTTNGLFFLDNARYPALFTVAAVCGIFAAPRRCLFLLIWFLCFWGVFIPFHAGSYDYGQDVRFSLLVYVPLAVMAAQGAWTFIGRCWAAMETFAPALAGRHGQAEPYSAESARGEDNRRAVQLTPHQFQEAQQVLILSVAIVLLIGLPFLPRVRELRQEGWDAREDQRFAAAFAKTLPEGAMVITHNPHMFNLMKTGAAQTFIALEEPETMYYMFRQAYGGVYFYYDYWCHAKDAFPGSKAKRVLDMYPYNEVRKECKDGRTLALFELQMPPSWEQRFGSGRK